LYKKLQENKFKEQKIIAGNASAQFETLKNQIDPHFLFNSLNVLSSLIEENPENAQKFTTSLSKIYRYVLDQKDKELVPLKEELNFAKTYMKLLYDAV
jgi:LytS/YehU family sensor histidine kinase